MDNAFSSRAEDALILLPENYRANDQTSCEVVYRGCYRNRETKSGGGFRWVVLITYVSYQTQIYSFVRPELMSAHTDDSWVDVLSYASTKALSRLSCVRVERTIAPVAFGSNTLYLYG